MFIFVFIFILLIAFTIFSSFTTFGCLNLLFLRLLTILNVKKMCRKESKSINKYKHVVSPTTWKRMMISTTIEFQASKKYVWTMNVAQAALVWLNIIPVSERGEYYAQHAGACTCTSMIDTTNWQLAFLLEFCQKRIIHAIAFIIQIIDNNVFTKL